MLPKANPLTKRRRLLRKSDLPNTPEPLPRRNAPAPGLHKPIVGLMGVWM